MILSNICVNCNTRFIQLQKHKSELYIHLIRFVFVNSISFRGIVWSMKFSSACKVQHLLHFLSKFVRVLARSDSRGWLTVLSSRFSKALSARKKTFLSLLVLANKCEVLPCQQIPAKTIRYPILVLNETCESVFRSTAFFIYFFKILKILSTWLGFPCSSLIINCLKSWGRH